MCDFNEKTVYILDSYGVIYRCYFAFVNRPLTNSKGQNISAIFGFFKNLHAVLEKYKPQYLVAAFDSRTPTFRHKMYDQYKATRQKTPEDLHAQIPFIENVLNALGVPVLRCDGYEADDIIATVAKKCSESGRTCRILSGDKDLMQLVSDTTQILKPDPNGWKIIGKDGVKAEWGVEPEKLLDLLSLYGDTADNIPGVKGVGVKTAVKFLTEYGSLEGIYEHADKIKGAIGEKVRNGKEDAFFSQKLIRLCDEVPLSEKDSIYPIKCDFNSAAKLLFDYGVPSVAKQYLSNSNNNDIRDVIESGTTVATANNKATETSSDKNKTHSGQCSDNNFCNESDSTSKTNIERMQLSSTEEKSVVKNIGNYKAICKLEELSNFIKNILETPSKTFAFDCETDGLNTTSAKILGFSLSYEKGSAIYVPIQVENSLFSEKTLQKEDAFTELEKLFNNRDLTAVMHNGKFDCQVLKTNGFNFANEKHLCKIADTMIAAWLLEPDRTERSAYSLETLAEKKLFLKGIEYDEIVAKNQTFADVDLEKATPYASEDADFTLQLWYLLEQELKNANLLNLFWQTEMKILPILAKMELRGIHLDTQSLNAYSEELAKDIVQSKQDIFDIVGHEFNIASTKQLQEVLFTERGLKHGKKTKTGYSTDTSVLEELAMYDPVPKKILEYRQLSKLQSTYVEALPKLADKDSRIHTSFMQTGTATGRLSSRDPNLQNIPVRDKAGRRIREAFTAEKNKLLISADYAQIELVVLAHLTGDKNMCKAFNEGTDVHRFTASLIFNVPMEDVTSEQRRLAKTINFGVIYGMSSYRLSNELGISNTQANDFIKNYFATFSAIQEFKLETITNAEKTGYVETIFGRRRYIDKINSRNKLEKSGAERIAINTPIQGSAADIVKKAMIDTDDALEKKSNNCNLLLQVHDELIFECPNNKEIIDESISLIKEKMENAVTLSIPLRVSIEYGKNWGEFH